MEHGIALEEALTSAIEALDGLDDRICPITDIQKNTGPLVIYDQKRESDERCLTGRTGLLEAEFRIHVLHSTYMKMRLLAEKVKAALQSMEGSTNPPLHIEAVDVELATPDLHEIKVSLFRRTYTVRFLYQIQGG